VTAFKSLTRVHTWILTEKRQRLAGIEELVAKMRDDLRQLEADLNSENRAAGASSEGTIAFPAFISAALERRRRLRQTIVELEEAVEAARAEVHAAFEEMKKYEHARDLEAEKAREERARHDRIELDDLGTTLYRRDKAAAED
jgi:flagellar export protein FliJ